MDVLEHAWTRSFTFVHFNVHSYTFQTVTQTHNVGASKSQNVVRYLYKCDYMKNFIIGKYIWTSSSQSLAGCDLEMMNNDVFTWII